MNDEVVTNISVPPIRYVSVNIPKEAENFIIIKFPNEERIIRWKDLFYLLDNIDLINKVIEKDK
ncbi:MAG TPA: hypothetical protein VNU45_19830 [Rummeliibacillus sp.]|nr:hypothetical protein [Rummeliibacillus sp.]